MKWTNTLNNVIYQEDTLVTLMMDNLTYCPYYAFQDKALEVNLYHGL
jgi:hypothetical protein